MIAAIDCNKLGSKIVCRDHEQTLFYICGGEVLRPSFSFYRLNWEIQKDIMAKGKGKAEKPTTGKDAPAKADPKAAVKDAKKADPKKKGKGKPAF
eukprot:m.25664 g.25664  ORF g.25664 m.25664 type:complete len:95 (+) comp5787_c1_seq1:498-782(+)